MAKKQAQTETEAAEAQAQPEEASAPAPARKSRSRKARAADAVEAAAELAPEPDGPAAEPEAPAAQAPAAPEEAWPEAEEEWAAEVESAYLQSKYTLVSVAAKRARQLLGGSKRRVDSLSEKPVTVALEELAGGKLYFERTRDGIK